MLRSIFLWVVGTSAYVAPRLTGARPRSAALKSAATSRDAEIRWNATTRAENVAKLLRSVEEPRGVDLAEAGDFDSKVTIHTSVDTRRKGEPPP